MTAIFTSKITIQISCLFANSICKKNIQDAKNDAVVRDLYVVGLLWHTFVTLLPPSVST